MLSDLGILGHFAFFGGFFLVWVLLHQPTTGPRFTRDLSKDITTTRYYLVLTYLGTYLEYCTVLTYYLLLCTWVVEVVSGKVQSTACTGDAHARHNRLPGSTGYPPSTARARLCTVPHVPILDVQCRIQLVFYTIWILYYLDLSSASPRTLRRTGEWSSTSTWVAKANLSQDNAACNGR